MIRNAINRTYSVFFASTLLTFIVYPLQAQETEDAPETTALTDAAEATGTAEAEGTSDTPATSGTVNALEKINRDPAVEEGAPTEPDQAVSTTEPDSAGESNEAPKEAIKADTNEEELELVGYDKGFFIQSREGKFKISINGLLQARFTYENSADLDDQGDEVRESEYKFSLPRIRLKLKGHAFTPKLKYSMQVEFGKGLTYLKEFYVDAAFAPNVFHLLVGQFKPGYARQQAMSPAEYEFNDPSSVTQKMTKGFDLGVMLHNNYKKAMGLEWSIAAINGTGDKPWFDPDLDDAGVITKKSTFTNVPDQFMPAIVARIGYNYGGLKGYSEADLEGGGLRLGVGAGGFVGFAAADHDAISRAAVDAMIKVHGFSLSGAFYLATRGDELSSQKFDALGFYAQAGHVFKKTVQTVVRYARYDPSGSDNAEQEILGGLSVYFFGHNLKWQTEGGAILYQEDDLYDYIARTQLQFAF